MALYSDHDVINAAMILRIMQMQARSTKVLPTNKYRSSRCGSCHNCVTPACGMCAHCKDSPRFGGPGVKKQSCLRRECKNRNPPIAVQTKLQRA